MLLLALSLLVLAAPHVDYHAGKHRHCPAAVPGAQVNIRDIPEGVELVITSSKSAGITAIRTRAQALMKSGPDARRGGPSGQGRGEGGGWMKECPVLVRDTQLQIQAIHGGVRIQVRPTGPLTLEALRAETRARWVGLSAPGSHP